MIYKIDAAGDTLYVEASTEAQALSELFRLIGPIPHDLLTIGVVDSIPIDAELLNS